MHKKHEENLKKGKGVLPNDIINFYLSATTVEFCPIRREQHMCYPTPLALKQKNKLTPICVWVHSNYDRNK